MGLLDSLLQEIMKLFVVLSVFFRLCWTAEIAEEEGVLVLTTDNFQEALDANSLVLVEFYAPWCGHCKSLAPEYAKAAQTLAAKGSVAKLAKVDATENKELGQKFGVKGYPTLKFFKDGEPQEYTGGRTADTILEWVEKKSGPSVKVLETREAANTFVKENKVVTLGLFKDLESKEAVAFRQAADSLDDVIFGITGAEEVFPLFDIKDDAAVLLLKKFDEGRNQLEGDITKDTITKFVTTNFLPLVVDFHQDTAKQIFQGDVKSHFLIFASASDAKFEYILHAARKVAADVKGDMMFVSVTTDEPEHKRVIEFFGIQDSEVPTFRITSSTEDMIKYKPENTEMTEENFRAFLKSFQAGELSPHLKSQALPEDWNNGPVKVLVSSNFNEIAKDASADVLVEFYAPWCGHCKKLAPIWDELGEKFSDNDKIVIAKIDMTENELEDVKVRGFPTIKLFKAGDNEVVDYAGGRSLADFVKFLDPSAEEEAGEEEGEVKDEKKAVKLEL